MRFKSMMRLVCLVPVAGLLVLAPGCDSGADPNAKPAAPAQTQAQQDAERAAREKAYGGKTAPVTKSGAHNPIPAK